MKVLKKILLFVISVTLYGIACAQSLNRTLFLQHLRKFPALNPHTGASLPKDDYAIKYRRNMNFICFKNKEQQHALPAAMSK